MCLCLDLLTRSFLPSPNSVISNALGMCLSIWNVVVCDNIPLFRKACSQAFNILLFLLGIKTISL
jgi:Na+-translocating ferredoxin:NAD+ oxidoreductase RnfE subunit